MGRGDDALGELAAVEGHVELLTAPPFTTIFNFPTMDQKTYLPHPCRAIPCPGCQFMGWLVVFQEGCRPVIPKCLDCRRILCPSPKWCRWKGTGALGFIGLGAIDRFCRLSERRWGKWQLASGSFSAAGRTNSSRSFHPRV